MSRPENKIPKGVDRLFDTVKPPVMQQDVTSVNAPPPPNVGWREFVRGVLQDTRFLPEGFHNIVATTEEAKETAKRQKIAASTPFPGEISDILSLGKTKENREAYEQEIERKMNADPNQPTISARETSLLEKIVPPEIRQHFRLDTKTAESPLAKGAKIAGEIIGVNDPISMIEGPGKLAALAPATSKNFIKKIEALMDMHLKGDVSPQSLLNGLQKASLDEFGVTLSDHSIKNLEVLYSNGLNTEKLEKITGIKDWEIGGSGDYFGVKVGDEFIQINPGNEKEFRVQYTTESTGMWDFNEFDTIEEVAEWINKSPVTPDYITLPGKHISAKEENKLLKQGWKYSDEKSDILIKDVGGGHNATITTKPLGKGIFLTHPNMKMGDYFDSVDDALAYVDKLGPVTIDISDMSAYNMGTHMTPDLDWFGEGYGIPTISTKLPDGNKISIKKSSHDPQGIVELKDKQGQVIKSDTFESIDELKSYVNEFQLSGLTSIELGKKKIKNLENDLGLFGWKHSLYGGHLFKTIGESDFGISINLDNGNYQISFNDEAGDIIAEEFSDKKQLLNFLKGVDSSIPGSYLPKKPFSAKLEPADLERYTKAQITEAKTLPSSVVDNWVQVGSREGTNPGGWFEAKNGPYAGTRFYVKFYDDPTQARGEYLSNLIYQSYGSSTSSEITPESFLFADETGKIGYASKDVNSGLKGKYHSIHSIDDISEKQAREFFKNAHLDILLGNWDVVQHSFGNVLNRLGGSPDIIRIDQGGSLLHRGLEGRKPTDVLNQITEWDKFPKSGTYRQVMNKAGYEDFDDLAPVIQSKIMTLPEDWTLFVNTQFRDWNSPDKDAIIEMLNNRTRLLKEKAKDMDDRYFQKFVNAALEEDPNWVEESWPLWHKIMKSTMSPEAKSYFNNVYLDKIRTNDPDFREFKYLLDDWFGDSREIKGALSEITGINLDKYRNSEYYSSKYDKGARVLLNTIDRETETSPILWRGKRTYAHEIDWIDDLREGDIIDLLPSSFSSRQKTAVNFVGGPINLVWELEPNSKALRAGLLSHHQEYEWITGGRVEIVGIRNEGEFDGKPVRIITIRQKGTYNAPEKD